MRVWREGRYSSRMEGDTLDPFVAGAVVRAGEFADKVSDSVAKETGSVLARLFGPSADVMGTHWADQLREKNLNRLLRKTEKRAKEAEEKGEDPGYANPRVASQVFEAAQYSDQEVVAEYLSGVLSSSRDATGQSDNGVSWSGLVSRLSSDQLKVHYMIYASVRTPAQANPPAKVNLLHLKEVVLPLDPIRLGGGFDSPVAFSDAVNGLMREGLIGDGYSYGPRESVFEEHLKNHSVTYPHEFAAFRLVLTIHGIRLFLWGVGAGGMANDAYIDSSLILQPVEADGMPSVVEPTGFLDDYLSPKAED